MPEITYELVAPLVEKTVVSNNYVTVHFLCPVSGDEFTAGGTIHEAQGTSLKKEVKRNLWRNIRWSLSRMMYGVFGYGVGGAVASTVADAAGDVHDSHHAQPTQEELKAAIVDIFKDVSDKFAWDESNQRYVAASVFKDLQTEFAVQVQGVRIHQAWDRSVLARMLAEIAAADEQLADSERELFHHFLKEESLDAVLEKPPLSKADLEETSREVRYAMWLLAAAMAVSDEDFAKAEADKLAFFGTGLGISAGDQARGLAIAKEYVLDQALEAAYADGKKNSAEQQHVAHIIKTLGIDPDRAARLDTRCRKRKGIF